MQSLILLISKNKKVVCANELSLYTNQTIFSVSSPKSESMFTEVENLGIQK